MALSGTTTANATEEGSQPAPESMPAASAEADGQVITVTVSGTGYRVQKGESSGSGSGGSVQLTLPAPCWMTAGDTGKEFYEYVDSGQMAIDNHHHDEHMTPYPGYQTHKDDDLGHWYGAQCSSANWPDQNDLPGFFTFVNQYFADHPAVYYPVTEPLPTPHVPPELLREVAIKQLTLPDPALDWNPKLKGNDGTLVNLDTWFWLDNAPKTLFVQAAAGDSAATITATFAGMDITAPGEDPLPCNGFGVPYAAGATTTCSLAFSRASVALGTKKTPVTVKTRWTATWAANGADQGPVMLQTEPDATVDIRVDEIQTLVTSAR